MTAVIGADQEKMRVTSLDHWIVNVPQPLRTWAGLKERSALGGGNLFSAVFRGHRSG